MSILNRPSDGLVSVLIALRRAVLAYGPLHVDRLLALVAPPSVVAGSKQARQTLNRWTQLGVFTDDDGVVGVAPPFEQISADDVLGLRHALIRVVMSDVNNPSFDKFGDADITERPLASDFTRAASWALAQDTYAVEPSHPSIEALQNAQLVRPVPFVNDTRWQGFIEWSVFLGFASRSPRLLLEPHFAVAAVLNEVFTSDVTLPIETFLARITAILPVLDRGRFRLHVESTMKAPPYVSRERDVSVSLSAALLHLEQASAIRLEARSDASTLRLLGHRSRELAVISHITRCATA